MCLKQRMVNETNSLQRTLRIQFHRRRAGSIQLEVDDKAWTGIQMCACSLLVVCVERTMNSCLCTAGATRLVIGACSCRSECVCVPCVQQAEASWPQNAQSPTYVEFEQNQKCMSFRNIECRLPARPRETSRNGSMFSIFCKFIQQRNSLRKTPKPLHMFQVQNEERR